MSVAVRHPMTVAEFLTWEERQDLRWEFDGFQPVAMTGGTFAHEIIGGNIRYVLRSQLGSGPCRILGPTLKIEVVGRIREIGVRVPMADFYTGVELTEAADTQNG